MVATNQNQWALKWPYTQPGGALPVVNDTVPDQLARLTALNGQRQAAAQDTGWSSTPNTLAGSVDYGAGQQGAASAYTGNAWQDYQNPSDNASWNYTTDPLFDASKNVKRWDLAQTGAASEDDRAKAYRLAFDYLKSKYQITSPGQATPQQMQEAYLYGIQRVKTDLMAPENAKMGGWQSSPLYGYDKYLPGSGGTGVGGGRGPLVNDPLGGTTGATQQGGARGGGGQVPGAQIDPNTRLPGSSLPNGGMSIDYANGQQPGGQGAQTGDSTVNPPYGQGAVTGAQSAGATTQPGGNAAPGVTYDPNNPPQAGQAGYAGFVNMNNPQNVVRQYMQSHGISPDSNMFFSDFIKKLMGNLIPTIMQLTVGQNGKPALDRLGNINGILDPLMFGGQGTMGGNLANFANQAQGALTSGLPGMDASTQADLLRNLTALRTVSDNPYMAQATNNRLDAAIGSAQDQAFKLAQTGGKMGNNWSLWDYINNQLPQGYANPFQGQR